MNCEICPDAAALGFVDVGHTEMPLCVQCLRVILALRAVEHPKYPQVSVRALASTVES